MTQFIDRRPNSRHKSAVNRARFIRRFKKQIKQAVSDAIAKRSITNINSGETVTIPRKDIQEPTFGHGQGGQRDIILPGNNDFMPGDKIKRPPNQGGQGGGEGGSPDGEGEDDFGFELSKEEFLDVFFEDLALPNLVKRHIVQTPTYNWVRAGYTSDGVPSNINVIRSLKGAMGRRLAIGAPSRKKIKKYQEELAALEAEAKDPERQAELKELIAKLRLKIEKIPFIDPFDLKYNNRIQQPKPSTQAVMFCLMDVSGSMDETKKDIAKRFFILLYLFLNKTYKKIDLVFIRHHTSAKEVDEQEFFYSRETGGTVVSSALEMMGQIIQERYSPNEWNIYGAQASDGDNWNNDSPKCRDILCTDIMPFVQYFAYVEIMPRHHQSLWDVYEQVKDACPGFAMETIQELNDIYPVFRELFKKQQSQFAAFVPPSGIGVSH